MRVLRKYIRSEKQKSSCLVVNANSVTMRLQILLAAFIQVETGTSFEVSGYIGDNVTLPSGADPSWRLSRIFWSVLSNYTWIATYRNLTINVDRFYAYKGRLTLNPTSGDLTIHNLRQEDAKEYTVDLLNTDNENKENKIRLKVKKLLQPPTIEEIHNTAVENGCFMLLNCSSRDNNVDLSWKVTPHHLHASNNTKGGPSQLLVYVNMQDSVEFTCTSSREMEHSSQVTRSKCKVAEGNPPCRERWGIAVFCIFLGVALIIFILLFKEKLCTSK